VYQSIRFSQTSVEDAALVGWDHILYVDECVLTTVGLKHLEGLLDQVPQVQTLSLAVVNLVSDVCVALLEQIHYRQDLSVVRNKRLSDCVRASNECLQNFEGDGDNFTVTCVQGG
jgi:hypothetical protein